MKKLAIVIFFLSACLAGGAADGATAVHHDLDIVIQPDNHRLIGSDAIQVEAEGSGELVFQLASQATDLQVWIDDQPARFLWDHAYLRVNLHPAQRRAHLNITIQYTVVFNDPVPVRPVNTDNPGYGVSGTIQPQGAFLLAGSGWYPHLDADEVTYGVRVTAPAGIVAVTAGRSLGHATRNGQTISSWQVDHPVRGLALSAAPYHVRERRFGNIVAATYFLPQNDDLAESYLAATIDYIKRYESLFGPYPFPKFAVVENFFPTGFGFASYTLIGGRVLRLPFIIRTSLGHEIAHCWWGNGVQVDYDQGNWSEGLTTYCADYLYREEISAEDARAYRLQMLRNYATLVGQHDDMPLDRFRSRYSPATRAIGYDKGAMVFHMLRRLLGEDAFWGALQDVYRDHLFAPVTWQTFQRAFEQRSHMDLDVFFQQWLNRDGAPQMALADLKVTRQASAWVVSGQVVQKRPYYEIATELRLKGEGAVQTQKIKLAGAKTPFRLRSQAAPVKLVLDSAVDIFRRLDVTEIPPAINSIKGATDVVVVLDDEMDPVVERATQTLLTGLGLTPKRIVKAQQAGASLLKAHDLLLVGTNGGAALGVKGNDCVDFTSDGFVIDGTLYNGSEDVFFGVFAHPLTPQRVAALFWPLSPVSADIAARKITHYGKYSYLAFHQGRNRIKGVWPVIDSPLVYRWSDETIDAHPTRSSNVQ